MAILTNRYIRLEVDENARITHLERIASGHGNIINEPAGLYRVVMQSGDNWEDVAFAANQTHEIIAAENEILIRIRQLTTKDHTVSVAMELRIRLEEDRLLFDADITNSDTVMVNDFFYPVIGRIKTLSGGKPELLWPYCAGQRIPDIGAYVSSISGWDVQQVISESYPGMMSMQWMSLIDQEECLYFAGHDDLFHTSVLRVAGSNEQDVSLEMDKLCFVRQGETWHCPAYIVWMYQGDWVQGAREYKQWAETWRKPVEKADWIRNMNGYFLVINKQQYGDEIWPYETLPELYEMAEAHGCDALGLFGWYHSGHDNYYPDLEVSPTMGGADVLRENIKAVQERGGHVTLYYQGHLIDTGTDFYKEIGHKIEGRTRWNTPYLEEYSKFHNSEYLKKFSKKLLSTVCPSCTQWHDLMAKRADWVASFGANGMLYDQIGGMPPYPCFNDSHPHMHGRPSLSYTQGRLKLLDRLNKQAKSHGHEFAFMSEHETDVYSQYLDAVHGIAINPGPAAGHRRDANPMLSVMYPFPEMFRYCFPDAILTLRNPKPYIDPRYVNFAILYGFRYEIELRYLKDQDVVRRDEHKESKEYAYAVGQLRRKYAGTLLKGTYKAQDGILKHNPDIQCALFEGDDATSLVLLNDTAHEQPVDLEVEGMRPVAWETIQAEGRGMPASLEPGQVAVVVLEKTV